MPCKAVENVLRLVEAEENELSSYKIYYSVEGETTVIFKYRNINMVEHSNNASPEFV